MSYKVNKEGEISIGGFEQGIFPSPHKGVASLKGTNIVSETGEVMCNFDRVNQITSFGPASAAVQGNGTDNLLRWYISNGAGTPYVGQAVQVTASTITNFSTTTGSGSGPIFYVQAISGPFGSSPNVYYTVAFSLLYGGVAISNFGTTGSATIESVQPSSSFVCDATETYYDGANTQYRYYIYESAGYVWVQDTGAANPTAWFLIDVTAETTGTGLIVFNGFLHLFTHIGILTKLTAALGASVSNPAGIGWTSISGVTLHTAYNLGTSSPHFAQASPGTSGNLWWTDNNFIGTILLNAPANTASVQSYGEYSQSSNNLSVGYLLSGNFPLVNQWVTFQAAAGGSVDSAVNTHTAYYVISIANNSFKVSATQGGATISWNNDASGTQYFNTYSPSVPDTFGADTTACTLPGGEIATCFAPLAASAQIVIGCQSNNIYTWDGKSVFDTGFIPLAEDNCAFMLTVNNAVYIFTGSKGNIYVTNGSLASAVLTVPDYLAGTPGTPSTYVEPYFTWGQAFLARGRVFFSVIDNNSNCGGVYSFIPSFFNQLTGQDVGSALRLENGNSSHTYGTLATVLFPAVNQNAIGVQYFAAWSGSVPVLGTVYRIDYSATVPVPTAIVETDLIPTGTLLQKKTFKQIEYKLSAPLAASESVAINYRQNSTDAWGSAGTVQTDSSNLSGLIPVSFEAGQWLQLQVVLTSNQLSTSSFVRLCEILVR